MRSKKKERVLREAPARSFAVSYAAIVVCYAATCDAVCVQRVSGRAQNVAANRAGTTVASTTALFFWSGVLDLFQMPLASEFATISLVCPFSKVKLILKVFLASREGTSRTRGLRSKNCRGLAGRPWKICRRQPNRSAPMPRQRSNELHGRAFFRTAFLFFIVVCF